MQQVESVLILAADEARQRLCDETRSRQSQQAGGGQIGLRDQSPLADRAVADRGNVVEVEITRVQFVQCQL